MLNQFNIVYQSSLLDAVQKNRAEFEQEAKLAMAVKLFEMKKLSSGMAAQLIGMDRATFLLNLHHFGVAMINLDEDELMADVNNA
jgi:predicted HTH domain antitoxin